MTAENEYRLGRRAFHRNQEESIAVALAIVAVILLAGGSYILVSRFHVRSVQLLEGCLYAFFALVAGISLAWYLLTLRRRREANWPHPPLFISQAKDREAVEAAYAQNAIVLGYDVHGKPWFWPDATRVMQSVVLGATGSGKTTLLKNIITQDLFRVLGPPEDQHRIPMLIFDGKGDQEFLSDLLPAIEAAGRMHQLKVLSPSRPEISVRYNPFFSDAGLYEEHSNLVFESFDQEEDFFRGHQGNYLTDISRVLTYTGKRYNFYDVMVMALDPVVQREQIAIARARVQTLEGVSNQRRLNFDMSAKMLLQSLQDRERITKIQGLLNQLMTFLQDELSIVTGAYDEMLSLDEVIDQELILFVSLNTNKNSPPPPSCVGPNSASVLHRRPRGRLRQQWGSAPAPPRASALHQSSFRNLRLRFNYCSQMSQLTVTHPIPAEGRCRSEAASEADQGIIGERSLAQLSRGGQDVQCRNRQGCAEEHGGAVQVRLFHRIIPLLPQRCRAPPAPIASLPALGKLTQFSAIMRATAAQRRKA